LKKIENKRKCYNKIYCCFNEEEKEAKQVLVEAFLNYLEKIGKHLKNYQKRVNITFNR